MQQEYKQNWPLHITCRYNRVLNFRLFNQNSDCIMLTKQLLLYKYQITNLRLKRKKKKKQNRTSTGSRSVCYFVIGSIDDYKVARLTLLILNLYLIKLNKNIISIINVLKKKKKHQKFSIHLNVIILCVCLRFFFFIILQSFLWTLI